MCGCDRLVFIFKMLRCFLQLTVAYDKITSRVTGAVSQQLAVIMNAINGLSDYTEVRAFTQHLIIELL